MSTSVEHARRAASLFLDPVPELSFVQVSEHPVYSLDKDRYFLRLTSPRRRSEEQVEAELDFVRYLSDSGLSVSRPVPSLAGRWIEPLEFDGVVRLCVLFEGAKGRPVVAFSDEWNESLFQRWGDYLARLHNLSESYENPTAKVRPTWDGDPILASISSPTEMLEFATIKKSLSQFPDEPHGLIHGDLGRPNFHIDESGTITAFDFDDCCRHYLAFDIAVALWPLRRQSAEAKQAYLSWMLDGYAARRPITARFSELLPWLFRLRHLYMYLYNVDRWPSPTHDQSKWLDDARAVVGGKIW